jgi:signal recognition particle subunit SRP54
MFDSLTESLGNVFRKLSGRGRLSESNIEEGLQEVRRALLSADVNFKIVKDFIDRVKAKALGEEVLKNVNPTQMIIAVVHRELVALMGPVDHTIPPAGSRPVVLLMAGLQGSGKTTSTAKLGKYLLKKGRKPLLVAADMIRPAAVEQLKTLGAQHNIPVYWEPQGRPVKICERGIVKAQERGQDVVLLDTQGRLHIDREMMDELQEIREKLRPDQVYLVVDAMSGQDAVKSADEFNRQLGLDGVLMTKLDGDARGGAALSVKATIGRPIKFVGVGERIDNLEEFHPERMADRILGMGDVVTFVEKAREVLSEEEALRAQEKLKAGEFNLSDFRDHLKKIRKMGPLKDVLARLPGGLIQGPVDEARLLHSEVLIDSMTTEERESPEILDGSRRQRIARGSGRPVQEINTLLRDFAELRKMMKTLGKRRRR